MVGQILDLLKEYESSLMANQELRLQFSKTMEAHWTKKPDKDELKAWEKLLGAEA